MKNLLFLACAALAVLGCSGLVPGNDGDLPPLGSGGSGSQPSESYYGACTYYNGSCSNNVAEYNCDGSFVRNGTCSGNNYYSSSSLVNSSSSRAIVYGTSVNYQGETYQTVVIGNQTWFARNLNYQVGNSKCYNNQESNCTTYGRLYDWATAMGFESSCNSNNCQANTKHQGICPNGWHIPSDAEWDTLMTSVGGSSTAGRYLKATSGWDSNGNGQDTYGFAALPGGYGGSDGDFRSVGYYGSWWGATEYDANYAYSRDMHYDYEYVYRGYYYKSFLRSVRCVQD